MWTLLSIICSYYLFLFSNRERIENLEIELASSKSALDEQCKRWRSAQDNYERQVLAFFLFFLVDLV
jgi:hypothetical protein